MSDRTYCEECERWVGGGIGHDESKHSETALKLAEETGQDVSEFEPDLGEYPLPDLDELFEENSTAEEL